MNLSQLIQRVHKLTEDDFNLFDEPVESFAMPDVRVDEGLLPGYTKFEHPDGRVDIFAPNGERVIDGEVADETTKNV